MALMQLAARWQSRRRPDAAADPCRDRRSWRCGRNPPRGRGGWPASAPRSGFRTTTLVWPAPKPASRHSGGRARGALCAAGGSPCRAVGCRADTRRRARPPPRRSGRDVRHAACRAAAASMGCPACRCRRRLPVGRRPSGTPAIGSGGRSWRMPKATADGDAARARARWLRGSQQRRPGIRAGARAEGDGRARRRRRLTADGNRHVRASRSRVPGPPLEQRPTALAGRRWSIDPRRLRRHRPLLRRSGPLPEELRLRLLQRLVRWCRRMQRPLTPRSLEAVARGASRSAGPPPRRWPAAGLRATRARTVPRVRGSRDARPAASRRSRPAKRGMWDNRFVVSGARRPAGSGAGARHCPLAPGRRSRARRRMGTVPPRGPAPTRCMTLPSFWRRTDCWSPHPPLAHGRSQRLRQRRPAARLCTSIGRRARLTELNAVLLVARLRNQAAGCLSNRRMPTWQRPPMRLS